jgi:hypothetical protein
MRRRMVIGNMYGVIEYEFMGKRRKGIYGGGNEGNMEMELAFDLTGYVRNYQIN